MQQAIRTRTLPGQLLAGVQIAGLAAVWLVALLPAAAIAGVSAAAHAFKASRTPA